MRSLLVACCVTSLLVASCSSAGQEQAASSPAGPATTDATIAPSSATKLVEGQDYDVMTTLPGEIDGSQAVWLGVDETGTAYGEVLTTGPRVDPGSMGQLDSYVQPVLMSSDGELTRMAPVRDSGAGTQMTGADADDRWVTWLESASGSVGSGMWTLFSYERATKKVRTLGSYRDRGEWGETGLDYDGRPEIAGDDVLIGMEMWGASKKGSAVLSAPLDGSAALDVLVPEASSPDVDDDGISYLTADGTLMYRDAATGQSRKISARAEQGTCQLYRAGVLLTCENNADGMLVRVAGPDGEQVYGPFRDSVSWVELHDGWARFVGDPGVDPTTYAVNVADGSLFEASASENDWNLMPHGYALVTQRKADAAKGEPFATGFQLIKLR